MFGCIPQWKWGHPFLCCHRNVISIMLMYPFQIIYQYHIVLKHKIQSNTGTILPDKYSNCVLVLTKAKMYLKLYSCVDVKMYRGIDR